MRITKLSIFIFIFSVVLPTVIAAQTTHDLGLSLSGSVANCLAGEAENPDLYCYRLRLTLKNGGNEPVIIINPSLGYGTGLSEVKFYFDYQDRDPKTEYFVQKTGTETVKIEQDRSELENFAAMSRFFEDEKPPENLTLVLAPGDSIDFTDKFEVKAPHKVAVQSIYDQRKVDGTRERVIETRWVGAESFTLKYEFSFLKLVNDPDFLEKLSSRWRRYGRLPIDPNGVYTITSDPFTDINGWRIRRDEIREKERLKKEQPV